MKAVLCDEPKCGKIVKVDEPVAFQLSTDDGTVNITLSEGVDRCAECARKLRARAARSAWNELKMKRKVKP